MESILNEKAGQIRREYAWSGGLALALLLSGIMLVIDFLFAPALIDALEAATGKFATREVVIRAFFLLFTFQLLLVLFFFLFVRPAVDIRKRLILYFLAAEGLILSAIWVFDSPGRFFLSEESALTFFSALVLTLCSVAAFTNLVLLSWKAEAQRAFRIFWGLTAAAFLFAALDEFFTIHERLAYITQVPNWGQDLFTAAYVFGACTVLAFFYRVFRRGLFDLRNYFFRLLLAGVAVLGVAASLDSFDFLFGFIDPYFYAYYLLNSLEELMEFTAAVLFCCAFVTNLLEFDRDLLNTLQRGRALPRARRPVTVGFALAVLLSAGGLLGLKFAYGAPEEGLAVKGGYPVTVFADLEDGLLSPDGVLFHPGLGLLVGNEKSGELLVFDREGKARVFAGPGNGLVSPEGLAVAPDGLYVADDSQGKVLKYAAAGSSPRVVWEGGLKSPEGLAVDSRGRLYLADEGLSMVLRLENGRSEILASALDGLITPEEMAFDGAGNLYVTDEEARSVFRITPEGRTSLFADHTDGLSFPEGIAVHAGQVYVTDNRSGDLFRFAPDGTGEKFLYFGKNFRSLSGIAFDDRGDLYVVANDTYGRNASIFKVKLSEKGF